MTLPSDIAKIKDQPTVFVIFGATGDLARKKLFPSLFELHKAKLLPHEFRIIATSRTYHTSAKFHQVIYETTKPDNQKVWQKFCQSIEFITSDIAENKNLDQILKRIIKLEEDIKKCVKVVIYLAIAPTIYEKAFDNLGKNKLNLGCQTHQNKARIVTEKPFGYDFESAQRLNKKLSQYFEKEQIFRIDHFLGKETVQNILAFRFGNEIFEPIWNRHYIDNVQITFTESVGIEKRGKFYDETGALRDVVQNHIFQLLALVTMEEPKELTHEFFREKRLEIVQNIKKMTSDQIEKNTIRGQYEGYKNEPDVNFKSQTETYVLLKLFLENERWKNVPFYIRTGKKLTGDVTSIILSLKEKEHKIFENFWDQPLPNHITIQIKPTEGIGVRLVVKKPGFTKTLEPVDMEFCYKTSFDIHNPDAYERLLMDVILGDQTLFLGAVGASWQVIDPIKSVWDSGKPPLITYKPGSWGPKEADDFIKKDGRQWLAPFLTICKI